MNTLKRSSLVVALVLAPAIACAVSAGDADIANWEWTVVNGDAPWIRRAGLQVVELDGARYLMGGRTSREPGFPPIPGDSDIWSDVWRSDDAGGTWEQLLETADPAHWAPRAYFRALAKGDRMYVLGGQDFVVVANPDCPPPFEGCFPFLSVSNFFNDIWSSDDGVSWSLETPDAGWSPRAGLAATVLNDEIYVVGGSFQDPAKFGGERELYNDVWKSSDGETWVQLVKAAPFAPRAGAILVAKDDAMYLIGGEDGFTCAPLPCDPPYFNDVWSSTDGIDWQLVTADAAWAPRPGHQVAVVGGQFVLFGGFGLSQDPENPFEPSNPMDVWVSDDGAEWTQVSDAPWNADGPSDIKYDFAITVDPTDNAPAIYSYGGDRETFNFFDPFNYLNIDNDVWRFGPPEIVTCTGDIDRSGEVDVLDFILWLLAIGPCDDDCPEDLNDNGFVGIIDLVILLLAWGPCA